MISLNQVSIVILAVSLIVLAFKKRFFLAAILAILMLVIALASK